jgi:hypothetical protein
MHRKMRIAFCLLASLSMPWETPAQLNDRFVVLPQGEGRQLPMCSRLGPKVAGTWDPLVQDILNLESHLGEIAKLKAHQAIPGAQIAHPEESMRQYLGIVVDGKRRIYINAFPRGMVSKDWRKRIVTICAGGVGVWGALYDPQTGGFSDLETNGLA